TSTRSIANTRIGPHHDGPAAVPAAFGAAIRVASGDSEQAFLGTGFASQSESTTGPDLRAAEVMEFSHASPRHDHRSSSTTAVKPAAASTCGGTGRVVGTCSKKRLGEGTQERCGHPIKHG